MECHWCGERFRSWDVWAVHEFEHELQQDEAYWARVRAMADRLAS
jgi:hypothetical protein